MGCLTISILTTSCTAESIEEEGILMNDTNNLTPKPTPATPPPPPPPADHGGNTKDKDLDDN